MSTAEIPALVAPSRTEENRLVDACLRASRTDWAYIGGAGALAVGTIYTDVSWLKYSGAPESRMAGSALVGLGWGVLLGGAYRSVGRCSEGPRSVLSPELPHNPEHSAGWAMALGAALTAPLVHAIARGPVPLDWSTEERAAHVVIPGLAAGLSSWLPAWRPVAPRPWNAYTELLRVDVQGDARNLRLELRGTF